MSTLPKLDGEPVRPRKGSARILLVDDEPLVLNSLRKVLERLGRGLTVLAVTDAEDAIRVLESQPVDLVVTDLSMPGKTGADLLERLQQTGFEGHRAVISGHLTRGLELKLRHLGAMACLQKPIEPRRFLDLCVSSLEGHRSTIHGLSPVTVAQMLELEGKSCLLRIRNGELWGDLEFSDGQLIDAWTAEQAGEEAAETILTWPAGGMQVLEYASSQPVNIHRPLHQLILNGARLLDERGSADFQDRSGSWDDGESDCRVAPPGIDGALALDPKTTEAAVGTLFSLGGAVQASLFDLETGRFLYSESLEMLEGDKHVAEASLDMLRRYGENCTVEDIQTTLEDHIHLMRPLRRCRRLVLQVVLCRRRCHVALAQHTLGRVERLLSDAYRPRPVSAPGPNQMAAFSESDPPPHPPANDEAAETGPPADADLEPSARAS
ncbi:MAG: response regulator [Acidobacteriota bacterium]